MSSIKDAIDTLGLTVKSQRFELGDLVALKAGGPKMVVEASAEGRGDVEIVSCLWFTRDEQTGYWRGPFRDNIKGPLLVKIEVAGGE